MGGLAQMAAAERRPSLAAMVAVAVFSIGFALSSLLYLSADAIDRISFSREKALVAQVIARSVKEVPHHQESVTVWDDAITQLRRPKLDNEWLDNNLGVWLHEYYSLDEAYILDPQGRAVYAMRDGARAAPEVFERLRREVDPLIANLRSKQARQQAAALPAEVLSLGATEVAIFAGHPSIISIKPIVTDTGRLVQTPGREFMHVAVRRLDGNFLEQLGSEYLFSGARFSTRADNRSNEASMPWRSSTGKTIGYLIWEPFKPGTRFLEKTALLLAAAFLLVALVTAFLVRRVHVGTRELQKSQRRAEHLALHDPLTGLPNRALFDRRLNCALDMYRKDPARQVALLYLDLDRFKKVNDSLGHAAGDELIRDLGQRLQRLVRTGDTVARLGGDEFAVILRDVRSESETESLCNRVIEVASKPFALDHGQAFVGVSIGVAFAGAHGCDARELARKADIALYEAKDRGRGCFTIYRDELDEPIQSRDAIERELREALEQGDQFKVLFQPQFSSGTGRLTGVEALVRWEHPARGPVSPGTFIPTAEETGLIHALGELVLQQACAAAAGWPVATVCVNVSPVQLRNPCFASRVREILDETGLTCGRLELEITETALIANAEECQPNIKLLRMMGVRVALDDFGTGYSSLSHISDFEVDRVKIDRSFVREIGGAASGDALVQAIVDLAHAVGLRITAEGVETEEQKQFLEAIGCDELQGFLLGAPMTRAMMAEFVRSHVARRELLSNEQPRAAEPARARIARAG